MADRPGTRNMMDATTRHSIALHGGHQSRESGKEIWANIPPVYVHRRRSMPVSWHIWAH